MNQEYLFTSARLGYRNWSQDDLEDFYAMNSDEEVMKYFPSVLTRDEVARFIDRLQQHYEKHGYCYFATEVMDTGEFIGFIGLAYQTYESAFTPATDIGWRLKRSAWGLGYATEGARRCVSLAFHELGMEKIVAVCALHNNNSERVMQKIGMTKKGIFDHPKLSGFPDLQTCLWYELLKRDVFI